jgi:hypothetical protein
MPSLFGRERLLDSAFTKTEVMVPMRDGVKLFTKIFTPKESAAPLPFMFVRTPYGIGGSSSPAIEAGYGFLVKNGYIFVFQDIRGKFKSEGTFEMQRPPRRDRNDPKAIDESTDAYDTVDWLVKNVPNNNGRVGITGVSYPGWLTIMAMLDPHPAVKAVSPQASPADMFIGDDFHHGGAFRLSYGFEYAAMMESSKQTEKFKFDTPDLYDWYLKLGSLANVNKTYFKGAIPSWNDFAAHPNWDAFWQRQAVTGQLDRVTVPTLNVAGWWDQEDFYGPVKIYETLEKRDTAKLNYLVVGPWNHGGWQGPSGQKLGKVDFGSPTSVHFRANIQAPWFAHWLKDKGKLELAEATTFESGSNTWQSHDSWPVKAGVTEQKLYLRSGRQLSFDAPADQGDSAFDAYVSDPANPVPYRPRPIKPSFEEGSTWSTWLADDQRFLKGRSDVLSWETGPLTEDVVVAGNIAAHLFAATTGSDADWVVKLIDVYPEPYVSDSTLSGHQLMVSNDVLRGRFRKSYEHPEAVVPNVVEEYTVDLHSQNYRFRKGHKIMVQVQSSWFPLIDRNPQTFVPNIFEAKDSDFRSATHRIYRSQKAASYVAVPIVGAKPAIVQAGH